MALRLKNEVVAAVKADMNLIIDLATLNGVSPYTVQDQLQRNRPTLTKAEYLWPIAKKLGHEFKTMAEAMDALLEQVEDEPVLSEK